MASNGRWGLIALGVATAALIALPIVVIAAGDNNTDPAPPAGTPTASVSPTATVSPAPDSPAGSTRVTPSRRAGAATSDGVTPSDVPVPDAPAVPLPTPTDPHVGNFEGDGE